MDMHFNHRHSLITISLLSLPIPKFACRYETDQPHLSNESLRSPTPKELSTHYDVSQDHRRKEVCPQPTNHTLLMARSSVRPVITQMSIKDSEAQSQISHFHSQNRHSLRYTKSIQNNPVLNSRRLSITLQHSSSSFFRPP